MRRPRLPGLDRLVAALGVLSVAGCGIARGPQPAPVSRPGSPSSSYVPSVEESDEAPITVGNEPSYSFSPTGPLPPGCHAGDPRAGVNTPLRLVVRNPCLTVHGIAGCIYTDKGDGDTHIALLLDPADARYLTPGNRVWSCGTDQGSDTAPRMVVEIIPQHCLVRADNCADRGHFTSPPIPENGQHITVTGAWVQDTATKQGVSFWSEVHPAFHITVDE